MCGICGFVGCNDMDLLKRMTEILAHRGPDDFGYYFKDNVGLGHRRLSIIDLNTGRQPLFNENKSICIVYNGEIYNYLDLRVELQEKGHHFTTTSDTEVIVHLYEELGVDCIKKLNGMFAFAIWDEKKKRLLLVRDRAGIKPLYYTVSNNAIFFASEIKSLLENKDLMREINPQALDSYLALRYVPGDTTLLRGIYKIPPANIAIYEKGNLKFDTYWQLDIESNDIPLKKDGEYIEEFKSLFIDVIKGHLMSDVAFGAFLSSGIDSGSVVGMMSKFISGKIKTFTVGFNSDIDETESSHRLSAYFDTDHTQIMVKPDSYKLLSRIMWYLDEPVGDAIIIPVYLLSKETAKSVKMVLTGEGADEIFGSYVHQIVFHYGQLYNRILPSAVKAGLNRMVGFAPVKLLDKFFSYPAFLGSEGKKKVIAYLSSLDDAGKAYFSLASVFDKGYKDKLYADGLKEALGQSRGNLLSETYAKALSNARNRLLNKVIDSDIRYWLPDYTLMKLDRLTMANSLEGRVPFLDYRLIEFSGRIPIRLKLRGLTTKYLLRRSMEGLLPKDVVTAPKRSFYFPTEKCFNPYFDTYVKDLLSEDAIRRRGLFNYNYLQELIENPRSPELLRNKQVMSLVILENWMRIYLDRQ